MRKAAMEVSCLNKKTAYNANKINHLRRNVHLIFYIFIE